MLMDYFVIFQWVVTPSSRINSITRNAVENVATGSSQYFLSPVPGTTKAQSKFTTVPVLGFSFHPCTFIVQDAIAAILASVTSDQISIDLDLFVFFHKMSVLWYTQSSSWLLPRDVTSSSYSSAIPRLRCKIYNFSFFLLHPLQLVPEPRHPTLRLLLRLECLRV